MDQIICDICGSEYAQTEDCCPVCGYPRQGTEKQAAIHTEVPAEKVKGGRFSRKNVRKRRRAVQRADAASDGPSNKPLWITIILLLIAIILVSVYIVMRFIGGMGSFTGGTQTGPGTTAALQTTAAPTTVPTAAPTIPCTAVQLSAQVLELEKPGDQMQLTVTFRPEDTTDAVEYRTSDPAVATVSADGLVTAVGPGQAQITVVCGAAEESCLVVCWQPEETTVPPQTEPAVLALDRNDVSMFNPGESFTLTATLGEKYVRRSDVTWTSSDSAVATVKDGLVTAVGGGTATITAKYRGQKVQCIVRCRFETPQTSQPAEGQEGQEEQDQPDWRASHTDVTISVGEQFRLKVTNGDGEKADAIWTMSVDGIVSVEGDLITGRAYGTVTLKTTVDGVTMTCVVRVRE